MQTVNAFERNVLRCADQINECRLRVFIHQFDEAIEYLQLAAGVYGTVKRKNVIKHGGSWGIEGTETNLSSSDGST